MLSGMPLEELAALLDPLPRFRAVQIFKWIAAGAASFDVMRNLPVSLREELAGRFQLRVSAADSRLADRDGTVKLVISLAGGAKIEAVLLGDSGRERAGAARYTACLSTQAGCPAGCVFCKTGALGFLRNLSAAEIVEQFLFLREAAAASAHRTAGPAGLENRTESKTKPHDISNIVVMGMGEPLLNLEELRRALAVITGKEGMNFSKRRVTVSTCGISDGIAGIADKGPGIRLALSLTTADEPLRRRLMPITARYPLREVKEALLYFQQKGGGRVTLEAVLLGGVNTRPEDAAALAGFARGLDAAVNLIPWNPVPGLELDGAALREPSAKETETFTRRLEALGLTVTRRFRKGRGVAGACGQLGDLCKPRLGLQRSQEKTAIPGDIMN